MLNQVNHWLEILAAVVDAVLLVRVLSLKLHRTYVFITLACVLSLMFDGVELWLGSESQEMSRVFFYSRFLYAFLFPLVVWDVFEELKGTVSRLRNAALLRLTYGLILAAIFGFFVSSFVSNSDDSSGAVVATLGLVLWAGSSSASLAFLLTLHRRLRAEKTEVPRNTQVWMIFYELSLLAEVLSCFFLILGQLLKPYIADFLNLLFLLYGIGITAWCVMRLRPSPSDLSPAREKAST